MKAPDKIYIQDGEIHRTSEQYDNDVCYIRKDALLEWLKERRFDLYNWNYHKEQMCWETFDEIIEHLNSM